jgi:two-component system, NtrC family, response regulator HydG
MERRKGKRERVGREKASIPEGKDMELKMTGYKVLLVDDDPAVLSVIRWALQDLGCLTTMALGGRVALARLHKETFDVMVTDLVMPDLDGFSLMKMAGKLDPEMKVIVMTGSPELLPHILSGGVRVDGFLAKPFGLNTLKAVISKFVGGKHSEIGIRAFQSQERKNCQLNG